MRARARVFSASVIGTDTHVCVCSKEVNDVNYGHMRVLNLNFSRLGFDSYDQIINYI